MSSRFDIREDFAIFDDNPSFAYLDSASTTLVPKAAVLETSKFLNQTVASARRGAHRLAVKGAAIVEDTRTNLAKYLGTKSSEISFQKSIPSAVASFVYGYDWQGTGKSKIVVAQSEENSILVPLFQSAKVLGLQIDVIPLNNDGTLNIEKSRELIDEKTGIVAVGHVTVGIGITNPLGRIASMTHDTEAILLTDASRSIGFRDMTITDLDADIVLFSANIGLMGPPGLALQWIRQSIGENHHPGVLGGSAVVNVNTQSFDVALQPDKFESGMINVPAIAGLKTALDYITELKNQGIYNYLASLGQYMNSKLSNIDGIDVYGLMNKNKTIFGFNLGQDEEISCHDVALFLDESAIAVRSGLLCAHPLIRQISKDGIIQASLHAYNSQDDIDLLCETLITIINELI